VGNFTGEKDSRERPPFSASQRLFEPPRCCWQASLILRLGRAPYLLLQYMHSNSSTHACIPARLQRTRVHICRATACCTERSRPALGPQMQSINQSINQLISHARCNPSQSPVIVSASTRSSISSRLVSPRMRPKNTPSLPANNCRRGRVASSAAPSPTAKCADDGPIMSSLTPNRHAASV
jgi:hypothetical protein